MSVLSRTEIERRLQLDVENPENLHITPLLDRQAILSGDSIDLRLGTHFIVPASPAPIINSPGETDQMELGHRLHVPLGSFLTVPAQTTVLGMTLEFIKIPVDLCGMILTKSSVARNFLVIETAPWIHPGYRGCLTLEIANVSNSAMVLYTGRTIGQLILMTLGQGAETTCLQGNYVGPVLPELPIFNHPRRDLEKIGIGADRFVPVALSLPITKSS
jgi:dCTP deaminase